MTDALRIDRLHARYRVSDAGAVERLDRLLADALPDALAAAVVRAGVPTHETVCVRRVEARVRVRAGATDVDLARAWAASLAEAIRGAVDGASDVVVRYPSRQRAFVDLASSVARGDTSRAWAWRKLGLWPLRDAGASDEAPQHALAALVREPEAIVAALCALDAPTLRAFAAKLGASRVRALVAAAVDAARVLDAALDAKPSARAPRDVRALPAREPRALGPAADPARVSAQADERRGRPSDDTIEASRDRAPVDAVAPVDARAEAAARIARTVLQRSRVARALAPLAGALGAREVAILALLEVDPGQLRAPDGRGRETLAHLARALSPSEPRALEVVTRQATSDKARGREPSRVGSDASTASTAPPASRREPAASSDDAPRADTPPNNDRAPRQARRDPDEAPRGVHAPAVAEGATPAAWTARASGRTRVGGLLFLLHVVRELDVPSLLVGALAGRTLRWSLAHLATTIVPIDARDPAALAFAGVVPGEPSPLDDEPPATVDERDLVGGLATLVLERARERLDPRASLTQARDRICVRDAEIVADPGWFDVRMNIADVALDVRRAGLDLDLGFLPWLGTVVRFVYE